MDYFKNANFCCCSICLSNIVHEQILPSLVDPFNLTAGNNLVKICLPSCSVQSESGIQTHPTTMSVHSPQGCTVPPSACSPSVFCGARAHRTRRSPFPASIRWTKASDLGDQSSRLRVLDVMLLLVRHLLLEAMHLFVIASCYYHFIAIPL